MNKLRKAAAALAALIMTVGVSASQAIAADAPVVNDAATAATAVLDNDPIVRNSTIGYYEYVGAADAVAWFGAVRSDPSRAQYLRLGSDDSATSLDNALKAALSMKRGNTLRTTDSNFKGRSDLRVSPLINAMAETAADWMSSNQRMAHQNWNATEAGAYNAAGQNIAVGYLNPYAGWYVKEKALYDLGVRDSARIGHYTNLTSSDFTLTGFGWSGYYSAQNFAASASGADQGQSLDAYIASLLRYKFLVEHDGQQPGDDGDRVPVYRLYNPYSGMHHYTVNAAERDDLVKIGWKDEHVAFTVSSNGYPVYRLYNPYDPKGLHHYTMSRAEADKMVRDGWKDEGVGWHVPNDGTVLVYRLYNPYSGEHLFTTSFNEYESNGEIGWAQESVAWVALQ